MFREMRRFKQQVTEGECIEILKQEPRGILSVYGEDGYPYGLPMDFTYEESTGKLYFHCAKEGHKIDALRANPKVSFCVMNQGFRKENDWALNITSVIIFGRVRLMDNSEEKTISMLRSLAQKYYPTVEAAEDEVVKAKDRVQMLELTIDHMTGKLVNES